MPEEHRNLLSRYKGGESSLFLLAIQIQLSKTKKPDIDQHLVVQVTTLAKSTQDS
jgi:hypothetical protein